MTPNEAAHDAITKFIENVCFMSLEDQLCAIEFLTGDLDEFEDEVREKFPKD